MISSTWWKRVRKVGWFWAQRAITSQSRQRAGLSWGMGERA